MINQTFQERVDFFMKHAGYGYDPETQSPFAGRLCCAMDLAAAERWVHTQTNYVFNWERDDDTDADTVEWVCMLVTALGHGDTLACCGGIDLGDCDPDAHHRGPYQRVIEAELALEAMAAQPSNIPLDVFKALSHTQKLALFDSLAICAEFVDLDVLRALCQWNDPNGEYDDCTRADLLEIIKSWREEG